MATSRERLGVHGEQRYEVPPLEVPDIGAEASTEQLAASESVQLFVERAVLGQHRFALSDHNARSVAQIVARLDGIPLAIELAAVKVKVLSTAQIAERLQDRFGLLADGTPIGRQRTLRAMMDWSYELLSESERLVLRGLSVFAGGFTLEAAEAIIPGTEIDQHDVVGFLSRLVDKSLVIADRMHQGRRYRLLDTVRVYAEEKLIAAGEVSVLRNAHRGWFLELLEPEDATKTVPDDKSLNELEMDHDNLRKALEWSVERRDSEAALRLTVSMLPFWDVRGYWTEGRQWLEAALTLDATARPQLKAAALHAAGQLAHYQGDYERAEALGDESLALSRDLGDRRCMARALSLLANVNYNHNDYEKAQGLLSEGLDLARSVGDRRLAAGILVNLGLMAQHLGDHDRGNILAQEGLAAFREVGDRRGAAIAVNLLGVLASDREDLDAARNFLEESLAIRVGLGDRRGIAGSLNHLGLVARLLHSYDQAALLYEKSLAIRRELGDRHGIAITLAGLGVVTLLRGDIREAAAFLKESLQIRVSQKDADGVAECLEALSRIVDDPGHAVRLLGAAAVLRPTKTHPALFDIPANHKHPLALKGVLGEESFTAAWREGAAMTLDQAGMFAQTIRIR